MEDWTEAEVELAVSDYLDMLSRELRREKYNKAEHNRNLQPKLNGRSRGSIEFKHQNISAALLELGLPYVSGYKPRFNYQDLVLTIVARHWWRRLDLQELVATRVDQVAKAPPPAAEPPDVVVPIPWADDEPGIVFEPRLPPQQVRARQVDYLLREARNRSLGQAGEEWVLRLERKRLLSAGCERLAERVEHVARTRGDGLGYDVRSFEPEGDDKFIEVKTTRFGERTPFYLSAREVSVSRALSERYFLYRVFEFDSSPRMFVLQGSLERSCRLEPTVYTGTAARADT